MRDITSSLPAPCALLPPPGSDRSEAGNQDHYRRMRMMLRS